MSTIVTHQNPDWDAIASVWLLKRYGGETLANEPVTFVNTGNPDQETLRVAVAVVDTGKVFDPSNWRFDHHQLPGNEANDTCAAKQVYEYLGILWESYEGPQASNARLDHLAPLVDLIFCGDTGRPQANFSRELGIHALLSSFKAQEQRPSDEAILTYGFSLLDLLDGRLRHQAEARSELDQKVVYKSADNRLWAIRHGSISSTFAAYEQGATVVVFEGEPIKDNGAVISYPIGVMRQGEATSPNVGDLVQSILIEANEDKVDLPQNDFEELESWFRHPAGFFAGRGTGKATDPRPVDVSLGNVARLVDKVWVR